MPAICQILAREFQTDAAISPRYQDSWHV